MFLELTRTNGGNKMLESIFETPIALGYPPPAIYLVIIVPFIILLLALLAGRARPQEAPIENRRNRRK